jgi:hypothetical protein
MDVQESNEPQQRAQQQPQEAQQQDTSTTTTTANAAMPPMNPQDLSQLGAGNGFMSAEAMAGVLQGQPFIPDPSMAGLPMPDQLMMPLMMGGVNGTAAMPPPEISAGRNELMLSIRYMSC